MAIAIDNLGVRSATGMMALHAELPGSAGSYGRRDHSIGFHQLHIGDCPYLMLVGTAMWIVAGSTDKANIIRLAAAGYSAGAINGT